MVPILSEKLANLCLNPIIERTKMEDEILIEEQTRTLIQTAIKRLREVIGVRVTTPKMMHQAVLGLYKNV